MILHPLRSELNWPVGPKEPLDFTVAHGSSSGQGRNESGLRWKVASHLLDFFMCWRDKSMRSAGPFAESLEAKSLLEEMSKLLDAAAKDKTFISTAPHLTLLDRGWYNKHLKPLMVRWMMLWLSGRAVGADQNNVDVYLAHGAMESPPEVIQELKKKLSDASMKMLNLSHIWVVHYYHLY